MPEKTTAAGEEEGVQELGNAADVLVYAPNGELRAAVEVKAVVCVHSASDRRAADPRSRARRELPTVGIIRGPVDGAKRRFVNYPRAGASTVRRPASGRETNR